MTSTTPTSSPTSSPPTSPAVAGSSPVSTSSHAALTAGDGDYHKGLSVRQVNMIAIGGAIGTGLFMGAGGRLEQAGPGIVFSYAICGVLAFFILRALGELVMYRPSSGSFVSYAREFYGEKAAFATGWLYWLNWAMTSIVDITAAALYMNFFGRYVPWIVCSIATLCTVSITTLCTHVSPTLCTPHVLFSGFTTSRL